MVAAQILMAGLLLGAAGALSLVAGLFLLAAMSLANPQRMGEFMGNLIVNRSDEQKNAALRAMYQCMAKKGKARTHVPGRTTTAWRDS